MKKMGVLLGAFLFTFNFMACDQDDQFKGSGTLVEQNREVGQFTKVNNSASINIVVAKGTSQKVEVSADDNIINEVKTSVENGALKVGLGAGNYIDVTITVSITVSNLEGLENTGSGNVNASGLENLAELNIDNEGSGNITLSGSGNTLSIRNSGSGNYRGFGFVVNTCTVTNSGSGSCEINCIDTLSGSNSGSGSVFYQGSPSVEITNTGSGEVRDSN